MDLEVHGEPTHTRTLSIAFTQGDVGRITFRADLIDLRKGGLMELGGRVTMAGLIHKMELHGAIEVETGRLESIEWHQSHVMHEPNPASRGECCRDPMSRLSGLVGTHLGEGFASTLKQIFGGPLGCTHINTLFQELSAFVARFQGEVRLDDSLFGGRQAGERIAGRSLFFDSFSPAEGRSATQLSVRLADLFYEPLSEAGCESVRGHDELRLRAEVDLASWQLVTIDARERRRRGPAFESEDWTPRGAGLDVFEGQSLGGGMARLALSRFAADEADARLLSALLSLGPGMTQVGAAVSDSLAPSRAARPAGSGLPGPGPCYMLRAEGPLMGSMFSDEAPGREG